MIQTYPNYLDQTQVLGLNNFMNYHSGFTETSYPLFIAISEATEYGITISEATEYGITISEATEYGITISEATEYGITITKTGGGS
jgi:hypothetical protein